MDKKEKIEKMPKGMPVWMAALLALGILLLAMAYMKEEEPSVSDSFAQSTQEDFAAYHTEEETRLAALLESMDGMGKVNVMAGSDGGVVVVAEGADEPMVCWKIVQATQAALGVPAQDVHVFAMKE